MNICASNRFISQPAARNMSQATGDKRTLSTTILFYTSQAGSHCQSSQSDEEGKILHLSVLVGIWAEAILALPLPMGEPITSLKREVFLLLYSLRCALKRFLSFISFFNMNTYILISSLTVYLFRVFGDF